MKPEEIKSRQRSAATNGRLKIRTLALRMAVGDHDLASKIKGAFDLAKSSGLELDLVISQGRV